MSATVMSGDVAAVVMGGNMAAVVATAVAEVELAAASAEVEFAACECCGLTEECTPAYIALVRARHGGRWICGLCAEAVKDEICRAGLQLSLEEAVGRHASFCRGFRSGGAVIDPAEQLITAVRQILRRSLESPRAVRSTPNTPPRSGLTRTDSI